MLSCCNLTYDLEDKTLFANLSLSLLPGSIYVLNGANGSGKTTLLKIIAGLKRDYQGDILWKNKPIDYQNFYQYILSYLGHENAVKLNLSVLDNLSLWADLKDNRLLITPALAQFKLLEYMSSKCEDLSKGWQKRVALARLIVSNGQLWLLDEPETNLDEEGRELLLKLLQVKINNGGMVIIASHHLDYYKKIPVINMSDFKYE
jgi:heme exporter protein A